MSGVTAVRDAVEELHCPKYSDSVWIGSFDALAGAAYALLSAEQHGFSQRNPHRNEFHTHARERIAGLIAEPTLAHEAVDRADFADWQSVFYFDAACDRVVWATEDLIHALAFLSCPQCDAGASGPGRKLASFSELWTAASARLEHAASEHQRDLEHSHVLLVQAAPDRLAAREAVFNPDAVLRMLRQDFRHRHSMAGQVDMRKPDGHHDRLLWSAAPPSLQLQTVCAAFGLCCRAHNELIACYGNARTAVAPAGVLV